MKKSIDLLFNRWYIITCPRDTDKMRTEKSLD